MTKQPNTSKSSEKFEVSWSEFMERIKKARAYLGMRIFVIQKKWKIFVNIPLNRALIITILASWFVVLILIIALIAKCSLVIEKNKSD